MKVFSLPPLHLPTHTIDTSNGYILLTTFFFTMLDLLISSVRGKSTILLPFNESNFCSIGVWIYGVIRSSLYVFLHFKNDASLLLSLTCALSGRVVEIDWNENNIDKVAMHPKEPLLSCLFFNWRIIALQCVSFFSTTARISCKHTYIPPPFELPSHCPTPPP